MVPAIENTEGFPKALSESAELETGMTAMIFVPMTRLAAPKETGVPETVTLGPLRDLIVSAIDKAAGSEPAGLEGSWGSELCGDSNAGLGFGTAKSVAEACELSDIEIGAAG